MTTVHPIRRFVLLVMTVALVAAACGSNGDDAASISLGEGSGGGGSGAAVEPTGLVGPTGLEDVWTAQYQDFDGQVTSLQATAAGQPVVLNFFASWCPQCVAEMPDFELVNQALGDQAKFIGLATADPTGAARELIGRTGIQYAVGLDPAGDFFAVYGGLGMPTTVFLTAEGEVTEVWTGALTEDVLTQKVQENLL